MRAVRSHRGRRSTLMSLVLPPCAGTALLCLASLPRAARIGMRRSVITRDNAMVYLDAVRGLQCSRNAGSSRSLCVPFAPQILQYRVVNPKNMIYSTQNLPRMLSKILQAQLRNVAGMLDVDQIIEDTAALDRVSSEIDEVARRWGVQVEMVKIQKVEAGELTQVLAQKKNADLKNKEVRARVRHCVLRR